MSQPEELDEVRALDAYEALRTELTEEQILFVWRTLKEYCGRCWSGSAYCCYDDLFE